MISLCTRAYRAITQAAAACEPLEDRLMLYSQSAEAPVHQWITSQAVMLYELQFPGGSLQDHVANGTSVAEWMASPTGEGDGTWSDVWLIEGAHDEDAGTNPAHHFVAGGDGDELFDGLGFWPVESDSAYERAAVTSNFFGTAVASQSYWYLGRVAHLLQDMTVPAHVNNDEHPNEWGIGDQDNYEVWAARQYYLYDGASAGANWIVSLPSSIESLFRETADYTDDYDSEDEYGDVWLAGQPDFSSSRLVALGLTGRHKPGTVSDGGLLDRYDDSELEVVADDLIPWAIEQTASLFRLFYHYVDVSGPVFGSTLTALSADPSTPTVKSAASFSLGTPASDAESGVKWQVFVQQSSGVGTWGSPVAKGAATSLSLSDGLYRIYVTAENGAGLTARSAYRYVRIAAAGDTPPPVLSNISHTVSGTSVTITWTTNEPATTQLEYGTTAGHDIPLVQSTAFTTSHSVTLAGLQPQTTYYYRLWGVDNAGNAGQSSDRQFVTGTAPATTGSLSVTIVGPSAAQWRVDSGTWHTSGDTIWALSAGSHTVSFSAVAGYTTPSSKSVTIAAGRTTPIAQTYTADQSQNYTLTVSSESRGHIHITPEQNSYLPGSQVVLRADADDGYHFAGWTGSASGTENPLTITMDGNKSIGMLFEQGELGACSLTVNISPAEAVAAGAMWRVNGGAWLASGTKVDFAYSGSVSVTFNTVEGWTKPTGYAFGLDEGEHRVLERDYVRKTGTIQAAITPNALASGSAMWRVDNGPWYRSGEVLTAGTGAHTISFSDIAGWRTPSAQQITVLENQMSNVAAAYEVVPGAPVLVSVSPATGPTSGGTSVVIRGANFSNVTSVMFGTAATTSFVVDSSTQITAVAPPRAALGTVAISVATPAGTATNPSAFTYSFGLGDGMELVGQVGGSTLSMTVDGGYAYTNEGATLVVLTIANPTSPVRIATCPLPGVIYDIAISGNYAYVAANEAGLVVVDITAKTAPKVVGWCDTPGYARGIYLRQGKAYIADTAEGLSIIDISNPLVPQALGRCDTPGTAKNVVVGASGLKLYAYVADYYGGLQIIDVTTASSPSIAVSGGIGGGSQYIDDVALVGSFVYLAGSDTNAYLRIVNVSVPTAPLLTTTNVQGLCPADFAMAGNRLYSVDGAWNVDVLDVSNPAVPVHLNDYLSLPDEAWRVGVSGQYAYVSSPSHITVLSFSNPVAPVIVGGMGAGWGTASNLAVLNEDVYVGSYRGLYTVDASTPASPSVLGYGDLDDQLTALGTSDGNLWANMSNRAFNLLDLSNPTSPLSIASYDAPSSYVCQSAVSGTLLIAPVDQAGGVYLHLVDLSTSSPHLEGQVALDTSGYGRVTVFGSMAYVKTNAGFYAVDIANPQNAFVAGSFADPFNMLDILASSDGRYVFVGGYDVVKVVDVTDPSRMSVIATYDRVGYALEVGADGTLYTGGGLTGVFALDVSNITQPRILASYNTPSSARDVKVDGNLLYVADGYGGLVILRQKDRKAPTVTIAAPTAAATFTTTQGSLSLSGSAGDDAGVTRVTWAAANGQSGVATGTSTWSASSIPLVRGSNVITISAFDASGNAGTDTIAVTCTLPKVDQTLTFGGISDRAWSNDSFQVLVSASSGLPVTLTVVSGPAMIDGSRLTLTGVGSITIRATQGGNDDYNAAAAIERSFVVTRAAQEIAWPSIDDRFTGDPAFDISAIASSGLPVTLSIASGPASLAGGRVTLLGDGMVTLRAVQPGDEHFLPVEREQTFEVRKVQQSILFGFLPDQRLGDAPAVLNVPATSGLPVTLEVLSGPAVMSDNALTIVGTGKVVIRATQDGNATFAAAPAVERTLTILGNTAASMSVSGTSGNDSIRVTKTNGQVRVTLNGQIVQQRDEALTSSISISAGSGNDSIIVSSSISRAIKAYGGDGNDSILGGAGNDYLDGGSGYDTIRGGSGNDRIYGQAHSDYLYGDSGNDSLYGGTGTDYLYGQDGDDTFYAIDRTRDYLTGGTGRDIAHWDSTRDSRRDAIERLLST